MAIKGGNWEECKREFEKAKHVIIGLRVGILNGGTSGTVIHIRMGTQFRNNVFPEIYLYVEMDYPFEVYTTSFYPYIGCYPIGQTSKEIYELFENKEIII